MFSPHEYRGKALEYGKRAGTAATANERREYDALRRHFTELADAAQQQPRVDNRHRGTPAPRSRRAARTTARVDAEAMRGLIDAYDETWGSLRGSIFAAAHRAKETREFLIRSLIESALHGERDAKGLKDCALRDFGLHCGGRTRADANGGAGERRKA